MVFKEIDVDESIKIIEVTAAKNTSSGIGCGNDEAAIIGNGGDVIG